jgi:hypothetical protein
MKQITLKKVNGQSIQVIEADGTKLVPIKPICDALGISSYAQREKIYSDEILCSFVKIIKATSRDGKKYKMLCLPINIAMGWLLTINPKNVKESSCAAVTRNRFECFKALFASTNEESDFLEYKGKMLEKELIEYYKIKQEYEKAKQRLEQSEAALDNELTEAIMDILFSNYKEVNPN